LRSLFNSMVNCCEVTSVPQPTGVVNSVCGFWGLTCEKAGMTNAHKATIKK
jgi:hypothetical protein